MTEREREREGTEDVLLIVLTLSSVYRYFAAKIMCSRVVLLECTTVK